MSKVELSVAAGAIWRAQQILSDEFYDSSPKWISEAGFTLLMINVNECLQILAKHGKRIDFKDDVPNDDDVTTIINKMRNAICHIGSLSRRISWLGEHSYSVVIGKCIVFESPELTLGNPYDDDVAFFYGLQGVLLKRHIMRATAEAEQQLRARFEEEGWSSPYYR